MAKLVEEFLSKPQILHPWPMSGGIEFGRFWPFSASTDSANPKIFSRPGRFQAKMRVFIDVAEFNDPAGCEPTRPASPQGEVDSTVPYTVHCS